jgi:large subunit ribosomal protein L13
MALKKRSLYRVDAKGKVVGRLASDIAAHLIGKHKADFDPRLDEGDLVEVANASAMVWTGKKMEQKVYHRHSTYPRGLKTETLKAAWGKDPAKVLRQAVSRMLPKNSWREVRLKRLIITN